MITQASAVLYKQAHADASRTYLVCDMFIGKLRRQVLAILSQSKNLK